jgi:hypothetical protein
MSILPHRTFFNFTGGATKFTPISAPYGPSTFRNWTEDGNPATDPDDDAEESQ